MKGRLHIEFDSINQPYLVLDVYSYDILPWINRLKKHLGEEYSEYEKCKIARDGEGKYHITIIPAYEWIKLSSNNPSEIDAYITPLIGKDLDFIVGGIGTATKNEHTTYFLTVQSNHLTSIRENLNLAKHDFHITLGFKYKDVFGIPKDKPVIFLEDEIFLDWIKDQWKSHNHTFSFLNKYAKTNYVDFAPIKLDTDKCTFFVDNHFYTFLFDVDNNPILGAKWKHESSEDVDHIPTAYVKKILGNYP